MTELLSREKEFHKLNEQLDKLANGTEPQTQPLPPAGDGKATGSQVKRDDHRFSTYTKNKGNNFLLKKRGAGDSDSVTDIPKSHGLRERSNANGARDHYRQTRTHKAVPQASNASSGRNAIADSRKDDLTSSHHRKYMKSPNVTNSGRRSGNPRASPSPNSTFYIKFRNPKFVESPSLENLIRDERNSILPYPPPKLPQPNDVNGCDIETILPVGCSHGSNNVATKKHLNPESLIKFLKSKVTVLEEDHDRLAREMSQQREKLEKTLERTKRIEQQRDQAYMKHTAVSEQLAKAEAQLEEANQRIKDRYLEQSSLQKELEKSKREVKMLSQANVNLEKRLYRATEELENTKNALALMKNAEREVRDSLRSETDGKDKQIKSLKKQRADLLNAYRKQLYLIENLKRQNECIEQSKMINFNDKEFSKVLEWNINS